ncbi:hypothetical protein LUX01_03235 [Streptomyces sudanensis]|uniref:hypothetical protein n=1 Tax=Streptomyces sudanensis TaxID=436397 RepID=UPI0020CBA290|nr:hypothetical protein [Streptomyces sudanensis]MCP9985862.1 hypothetical protein [Streptomyces sudanensis]
MGENVPVRCPACRRAHAYAPPVYPCACGAPVVLPLAHDHPPAPVTRRTWSDEWVTARCGACGRRDHWPQPELGCPCGTVLRLPVRPAPGPALGGADAGPPSPAATAVPAETPGDTDRGGPAEPRDSRGPGESRGSRGPAEPRGPRDPGTVLPGTALPGTGVPAVRAASSEPRRTAAGRPAFTPVTIRTTRDVVTTAALYLRWLGFREVVQPEERRSSMTPAVELRGPGLVAQVDPTTRPVPLRAVECLWLEGLASSSVAAYFSLAGYEDASRARADGVGLPLFAMDLTGTPQPVNAPAADLLARGA